VNILYTQPRIGSGAIPGWGEGGGGWYKDPAFVVPPAAAPRQRTVVCGCVVVHGRSREFHPVVRHRQNRMNETEEIVDATGITTHNIAGDDVALGLNNNQTLKSYNDEHVTKSSIIILCRSSLFLDTLT